MFSIIKVEQGSQEWLDLRRKHVTATDACKILQAVPLSWGDPYTCWLDKITGKKTPMTAAMQKGVDLEPFARFAHSSLTVSHIIR